MSEYKNLLVLSVPRSGTSYYTDVLKSDGYRVGHEHLGEDGGVSGFFFGDYDWYPYKHGQLAEKRGDYVFGEIRLLVRDPTLVVPSLGVLLSKGGQCVKWYNDVFDMNIVPEGDTTLDAAKVYSKTMHHIMTNEHLDEIVRLEDVILENPDIECPNASHKKDYEGIDVFDYLDKRDSKLALDVLDFYNLFEYGDSDG